MTKILTIILTIIFMSGCYDNPIKPDDSILPTKSKDINSSIQVELKIDTHTLAKEISKKMPKVLLEIKGKDIIRHSSGSSRKHGWFSGTVKRTKPFQLTIENRQLVLTTTVDFHGRVNYKKCTNLNLILGTNWICGSGHGNLFGQAKIQIKTNLDVTSDWKIESNQTVIKILNGHTFATAYGIVLGTHLNANPILMAQLNSKLRSYIPIIEKEIRKISIKSKVEELWKASHITKQIGNKNIWFRFTPKSIGFNRTFSENNTLILNPKVVGYGNILTSKNNLKELNISVLPKLEKSNKSDNEFSIRLPIQLNYKNLAKAFMKKIGTEPIVNRKNIEMYIEKLNLYPSGKKVLIAVDFKANIKGKLFDTKGVFYLYGIPIYDEEKNQLSIEKLDYSVETKKALVNIIDFPAHKYLKKQLSKKLFYDMNETERYKNMINEKIESIKMDSHIILNSKLNKLGLNQIYLTKSDIVIVLKLMGNSKLSYK